MKNHLQNCRWEEAGFTMNQKKANTFIFTKFHNSITSLYSNCFVYTKILQSLDPFLENNT